MTPSSNAAVPSLHFILHKLVVGPSVPQLQVAENADVLTNHKRSAAQPYPKVPATLESIRSKVCLHVRTTTKVQPGTGFNRTEHKDLKPEAREQ